MKMENEIFSPSNGTVTKVLHREGDSVNTGDTLVVIA
jgi:biotin carboxyl carrier protein